MDERTEEFQFYNSYNPLTNRIERKARKMSEKMQRRYQLLIYSLLGLIAAAMIIHQYLLHQTNIPTDKDGKETDDLTAEEKSTQRAWGALVNTIYSIVVLIFGTLYKVLAVKQTEAENWRYQKQYTNKLIDRLFRFNLFNFYFPLMYVGFDQSNSSRMRDLFNLMLAQMAFKQVSYNLIEYYQPILMSKRKLDEHNEEYADLLKLYDDSQTENLILKKTLNKIKPQPNGG